MNPQERRYLRWVAILAFVGIASPADVMGGGSPNWCNECPCSGGVTYLLMRYNGPNSAHITVDDNGTIIFDDILNDGETFELNGGDTDGTFVKSDLIFCADGQETTIHVSCSQPIGVGFVYGPFTIEALSSRDGGSFDQPCDSVCPCEGVGTGLTKADQGDLCTASLRPVTVDGPLASFVMTGRSIIDTASPTDPDAAGSPGTVATSKDGAGVKSSDCGGSTGISGKGGHADEELIFTLDAPIDADRIVLGLRKIRFADNTSRPGDPLAEAGQDQTVFEQTQVTLDASGSSVPEGATPSYTWTQLAGPSVTLSDPNGVQPSLVTPIVSQPTGLEFQVEVSDGQTSALDSVMVIVNAVNPGNNPPVADAGGDQEVDELTAVVLNATGTSDPDADELSFQWTQVSGPTVILIDADTPVAKFLAPEVAEPTELVFRVTVLDGQAGSSSTASASMSSGPDEPVIFISSDGSPDYDYTILTSEVEGAFTSTGSDRGTVDFGAFMSLPAGLLIDAFKVRETNDHIYIQWILECFACQTNDDCDDQNDCTDNVCGPDGTCSNPPLPDQTACTDDGVACTVDVCVGGACTHTADDALCNDNNDCTDDACNPTTDCEFTPDDSNTCADADNCTTDACVGGVCQHTPVTCSDDGLYCDGPEACDPATGLCSSGPAPCSAPTSVCCESTDTCVAECCNDAECDDGDNCTIDACAGGVCQHTPVSCPDDGAYCNGPEACDPDTGLCASGPAPCSAPTALCCEGSDTCVAECCNDAECDDSENCTIDACVSGVCQHTPVTCSDDGLYCNGPEGCDPSTGLCASGPAPCTPPNALCCEDSDSCAAECCADAECPNDGVFCTGVPICVNGGCAYTGDPCSGATPVCCEASGTCEPECCKDAECNDGYKCTIDTCVSGACQHTPVSCSDDGLYCNGPEACDPETGQCASGPVPCSAPTAVCCEESDTCVTQCCADADCDDGDNCTTDACVAGVCQNTPISCADDGLYCNGPETCKAASGQCASGPDPCSAPTALCCEGSDTCVAECCSDADCDDGENCTIDACVSGVCEHTPVSCPDDGLYCNGPEACDPATGQCVSGPPPCSAPTDLCCEDSDTCVAQCCSDAECPDDGVYCNGDEVCVGGVCTSTGDPCSGATPLCCENLSICVAQCCTDAECADDGNECTDDLCGAGVCIHPDVPDGTECSADTLFCTLDVCIGGDCSHPVLPLSTPCELEIPADLCTIDHCDGAGACVTYDNVVCQDPDPPCEGGQHCDPPTGNCVDDPDAALSTPCEADGDPCTGEHCDGNGSCVFEGPAFECGDGVCECDEDCNNCLADCPPTCGDGVCECGEDACSCSQDCPDVCGDGCCTGAETKCNCPGDCPADVCGDGCCTGSESKCDCPADCPVDVCGDGCCTGAETKCDCPGDCPADACGDGCCTGSESKCDCPADCFVDDCGDGCCTGNETGCDCPVDCPVGECGACCLPDNTCIDGGAESTCDSMGGAFHPGVNCRGDADGDGADDRCTVIPTVSEWGLIILTLLLLTGGKVYFGYRRPVTVQS